MAECSAAAGDLTASGDDLYGPRSCDETFIDWVWDAYDFDKEDWDGGFGYWQSCDTTRPLARALNGLWCLEYSAPDPLNESYDAPILNWAGRFARENIDELDARCAGDNPKAIAYTAWGAGDEYTELYMGYFFGSTVSMRAGTIIHEARHADWVGHDDGGNDSSWAYNGAWRFQVSWLAWFIAKCGNTSTAMKVAARQRANVILNKNFTKDPGFRIGAAGTQSRDVVGVSRSPSKLDVFVVGKSGAVRTAAWALGVADSKWVGWWKIKSKLVTPVAPVDAVARTPERLDVFAVGDDGGVYTAAWGKNVSEGKWKGWWGIGGFVTLPGGAVTAVSRRPTQLDIFAVAKDGAIRTAAWDQNVSDGKWRGWWQIQGGVAIPGAPVSAVSRGADQLDAFVVGNDGGIYTATYDANVASGNWQSWTRIGTLQARPGTRVGVVARSPNRLDIFVVGEDGGIYTAAWTASDGKWRGWWQIQSGTTAVGSPVSAVAREPDKLDAFVVGSDGGIYTAAWDHNFADGKWQGWWRIKSGKAVPGSLVSCVSRGPDKLDVFVVGTGGGIHTAAWEKDVADGAWRGWWEI